MLVFLFPFVQTKDLVQIRKETSFLLKMELSSNVHVSLQNLKELFRRTLFKIVFVTSVTSRDVFYIIFENFTQFL